MEPWLNHNSDIQTQKLDIGEWRNRIEGGSLKDSDVIHGYRKVLMANYPSLQINFIPETSFEFHWR
jgi:hypothetical protein